MFLSPRLSVCHDGIKKYRDNGYFVLCYVGWVSEERGISVMLETMRLICRNNSRTLLLIAGNDDHYAKIISRYAIQHGLSDNILCMGKTEYEDIPGILFLSHIGLSLLQDNRVYQMSPPQKVIEYFAAGKPVIANRIETHKDLISDGLNGFITDYDPEQIAEKTLLMVSDRKLYEQMCKNALETALKYDTKQVYKTLKNEIGRILKEI